MDEKSWWGGRSPHELLGARPASDRKSRLLACAFARSAWRLLEDPRSKEAIGVAERFADGEATDKERDAAHHAAYDAAWEAVEDSASGVARSAAWATARDVAGDAAWEAARTAARDAVPSSFADLVRSVIPFSPPAFSPSWATPDVLSLARAAYEERILPSGHLDPARLAVLSDALEEAGADQHFLAHFRSGPHVRGMYGLDLLLGKE